MANPKLTKTELKTRNNTLKRFLPMLQFKKQQLQTETAATVTRIDKDGGDGEAAT